MTRASNTLRLDRSGKPNPSGLTYWSIETDEDARRTDVAVLHDGWYVAEIHGVFGDWWVGRRPSERIPAAVLAEMPPQVAALLGGDGS